MYSVLIVAHAATCTKFVLKLRVLTLPKGDNKKFSLQIFASVVTAQLPIGEPFVNIDIDIVRDFEVDIWTYIQQKQRRRTGLKVG